MTIERLRDTLSQQGADLVLPPLRHGQRPGRVHLIDTAPLPGGLLALVELADGGQVLGPMVEAPTGWRRARPGDGLSAQLVLAQEPLRVNNFGGLLGPLPGPESGLTVDQTNDSVVVGQALVKWQVVVSAAPAVAPTMLAHLREVGFTATTGALATVHWGDLLVAQVLDFLPGARDGWEWLTEALIAATDGGAETVLPWPGQIGRLLGEFHQAMTRPSSVLPVPVVTVAGLAPLHTCYTRLFQQIDELDHEMRLAVEPWRPRLRAALETVARADAVPALRIHGDAHVGQILQWEGGLALGDFDGNPLLPATHRADPGPTAFDVAAMLRSLDHVSRVVARRFPDRVEPLHRWSERAQADCLRGYQAAGPVGLLDHALLAAFADLSVLHEAIYAATYLPRWRYVPLAVLASP